MNTNQEKIQSFVRVELLETQEDIQSNTSLFESQILDSVKLVELINFIEKEFNIKVDPLDIIVENLDSVKKIVGFIERKQSS